MESPLDEQDLTEKREDDSLKDDRQINGKDVSFKPTQASIVDKFAMDTYTKMYLL